MFKRFFSCPNLVAKHVFFSCWRNLITKKTMVVTLTNRDHYIRVCIYIYMTPTQTSNIVIIREVFSNLPLLFDPLKMDNSMIPIASSVLFFGVPWVSRILRLRQSSQHNAHLPHRWGNSEVSRSNKTEALNSTLTNLQIGSIIYLEVRNTSMKMSDDFSVLGGSSHLVRGLQPPFIRLISHLGHLEGVPQPHFGDLRSPWLLTTYKSWDDPPSITHFLCALILNFQRVPDRRRCSSRTRMTRLPVSPARVGSWWCYCWMVQKSQGQPPFGWKKKPVKKWDKLPANLKW